MKWHQAEVYVRTTDTRRWPESAGRPFLLAILAVVLLLGTAIGVAASFTLTGTVACGSLSGRHCQIVGDTLTIISDDSGSRQPYTIDIAWIRNQLSGLDQDDLVRIEIERLPDGTLKAIGFVNITDQNGRNNDGQSTGSKTVPEQPVKLEKDTHVVTGGGIPPVARDDIYRFTLIQPQFVPASTGILVNDDLNGGSLTPFTGLTSQGNTVDVNADGSFTWTPGFGYNPSDPDLFTYTITNASGTSQATVDLGLSAL